jgi:hypothetical protein
MKKVSVVRILQFVLTGVVLLQTRALGLGCPPGSSTGSCESWFTNCVSPCTTGDWYGTSHECCTPVSGQCCTYDNTYWTCNGTNCNPLRKTFHGFASGPTSTKCENGACV